MILAGLAALLLVGGLAGLGRWEERRAAREEVDGMKKVLALVDGTVDSKRLTGYRLGPPDCFTYNVRGNPFGAQLCFDAEGRLVEAVDRVGGQPTYWSLTYRPQLSPLRVPRSLVDRVIRALETQA